MSETTRTIAGTVGLIVGLLGLSGAIGTYYVNAYRLDEAEARITKIEADHDGAEAETIAKIDSLKCFVAKLHAVQTPDCP